MSILLVIAGIAVLALGVCLCVRPYVPSPIISYGGLWLLQWSGAISVPQASLSFWGVVVAVMAVISYLETPSLIKTTQGTTHITVTSLAATLLGMTMGHYATMVVGACVGAVAGAVFFARTSKGAALEFPSSKFVRYMCAKCFPTAVTMALTGIAAMVAIAEYNSGM